MSWGIPVLPDTSRYTRKYLGDTLAKSLGSWKGFIGLFSFGRLNSFSITSIGIDRLSLSSRSRHATAPHHPEDDSYERRREGGRHSGIQLCGIEASRRQGPIGSAVSVPPRFRDGGDLQWDKLLTLGATRVSLPIRRRPKAIVRSRRSLVAVIQPLRHRRSSYPEQRGVISGCRLCV